MHESRSLSDFKSSVLTLEISGNFLSHTDTRTQTVTEIRPGRDTHTDNNCVYLLTLWLKCAKKYLPKYVCRFQRVYGYKLQLIMQTEQQKIKHYLWLGPLQQCSQKEKLILKHSGKQKSRKNRHLAASRLRRHNMFEESWAERAPHSRERERVRQSVGMATQHRESSSSTAAFSAAGHVQSMRGERACCARAAFSNSNFRRTTVLELVVQLHTKQYKAVAQGACVNSDC